LNLIRVMPAKGRTMRQPRFPLDDEPDETMLFDDSVEQAPLAAVSWNATSALILETNPAVIAVVREEMRLRCSGDLETAADADQALDMIGAASRPFDCIFLGTENGLLGHSVHVISLLRRQRTPSVVFAHSQGAIPDNVSWPWFVGIADWLRMRTARQWPRRVQQALDAHVSLARLLARQQAPWHMDPATAQAIYGGSPGDPFVTPVDA
jgi:hypothetical protein